MVVKTRRLMVWLGVIAYIILQIDFWNWGKPTLLFGWWPIEAFHHFLLTLVGGTLFALLLTRWGMPRDDSDAIRRPEERGRGVGE